MQAGVWLLWWLQTCPTTTLKIAVLSLIRRFYTKATALLLHGSSSKHEWRLLPRRCPKGTAARRWGQQRAASYKEPMKLWCWGCLHNFENCKHHSEHLHGLTSATVILGLTIFIYKNPFHQPTSQFPPFFLAYFRSHCIFMFKSLPLYSSLWRNLPESTCSKLLLSFIDCVPENLPPSVNWKADEWTDSGKKKT